MTNTFLYIATLAMWGTAFYAISLQLGTVPVEWSIAYRFGFGALVFFAFAAATKRKIRFSARDHLAFTAMGVFLFGLQYVVLYKAVFQKTPLERKIVAGAILGVAGIVMVFWNDLRGFGAGNIAIAGLALAICSGALASVGNLISERIQDRGVPVIQTNAYGMAYGAIFSAGLALAIGEPIAFEPTLIYAGSLIYLAGIATVFGFAFYLTLIGRIGAARTGYMWVMIPIVALAVSTVLEDYLWTPIAAGGIAAVLIGNALMLTPRRARSP
jgi:drug/metabolite transporter (DMT)-like permease